MLNALFRRKSSSARDARPRGADGKRCYAIGDVHGCARQLDELLGLIREDHAARPAKPTALVSLGDLIDRGPDSRGVIERFLTLEDPDLSVHVIGGNHEEMLLIGLRENPAALPGWLKHGGYAFCESYGLDPEDLMGSDDETIRSLILRAVPASHLAFLENTVERVRFGDYLLVHAGIDPERRLDDQSSRDLRWIREPFLESRENHGAVIVHGHTVSEEVEIRPNRIGVDIGAYKSGRLAAVRLEDTEVEVLTTS